MRRLLSLMLGAVLLTVAGFFAVAPSAPRARAQLPYLAVHFLGLSPQFQVHDIADVATLLVTADLCEASPTHDNQCIQDAQTGSPSAWAAPMLQLNGFINITAGPNQGLQLPFAISFNLAAPWGTMDGLEVLQGQAVVTYPDASHREGHDIAVAIVPEQVGREFGTEYTITSNQVDVQWVKGGAIDTGIFKRRTPVVEQAAAPAAPEVQAPATGTGRITAPNTGDAGLQASSASSDLALPLLASVAGGALFAALAFFRFRRRAI